MPSSAQAASTAGCGRPPCSGLRRRGDGDLGHAGHLRRDDVHDHRGRVGDQPARHVDAGPADRDVALGDVAPGATVVVVSAGRCASCTRRARRMPPPPARPARLGSRACSARRAPGAAPWWSAGPRRRTARCARGPRPRRAGARPRRRAGPRPGPPRRRARPAAAPRRACPCSGWPRAVREDRSWKARAPVYGAGQVAGGGVRIADITRPALSTGSADPGARSGAPQAGSAGVAHVGGDEAGHRARQAGCRDQQPDHVRPGHRWARDHELHRREPARLRPDRRHLGRPGGQHEIALPLQQARQVGGRGRRGRSGVRPAGIPPWPEWRARRLPSRATPAPSAAPRSLANL